MLCDAKEKMSAGKKNSSKPSNVFDQIARFNLNLLKLFGVYAGVILKFEMACLFVVVKLCLAR